VSFRCHLAHVGPNVCAFLGSLMTVSMRRATPSFRYCLRREFLQDTFRVTRSQYRSILVLKPPPGGAMVGRPRRWPRRNSSSAFSGRPRSMFSHSSASKNARAWTSLSNTRVREVSTWRMLSSHQNPAARSAASSGSGICAIHRSNQACTVPGPNRSQMRCSNAGSSQEANPLDSSVKPRPSLRACCLAHSCPLTQILAG